MVVNGKSHFYKEAVIHYSKTGIGSKVMVIFHGFGQDNAAFREFSEMYSQSFTIYSFDLFFHGQSTWGFGENPLEKEFWTLCMKSFFEENRIDRITLLGYSLGSRFALATAEGFPEKTDHIILVAPDGIKTNIWYRLATYPVLLRKLFKCTIVKPGYFNSISRVLETLRLVDKRLIRFAESQMNTTLKRKQVYYSWVVFRHLSFRFQELTRLLNRHQVQVTVVSGEYDKVIAVNNSVPFFDQLKNCQTILMKTGHKGLISGLTSDNALRTILLQD